MNLEWLANVRFGAHNGLKPDSPPRPKSANKRHATNAKGISKVGYLPFGNNLSRM